MKAILKFDMPEDQDDFDAAMDGLDWRIVAWELSKYINNEIEYRNAGAEMVKVRDELNELIKDNNLVLK